MSIEGSGDELVARSPNMGRLRADIESQALAGEMIESGAEEGTGQEEMRILAGATELRDYFEAHPEALEGGIELRFSRGGHQAFGAVQRADPDAMTGRLVTTLGGFGMLLGLCTVVIGVRWRQRTRP